MLNVSSQGYDFIFPLTLCAETCTSNRIPQRATQSLFCWYGAGILDLMKFGSHEMSFFLRICTKGHLTTSTQQIFNSSTLAFSMTSRTLCSLRKSKQGKSQKYHRTSFLSTSLANNNTCTGLIGCSGLKNVSSERTAFLFSRGKCHLALPWLGQFNHCSQISTLCLRERPYDILCWKADSLGRFCHDEPKGQGPCATGRWPNTSLSKSLVLSRPISSSEAFLRTHTHTHDNGDMLIFGNITWLTGGKRITNDVAFVPHIPTSDQLSFLCLSHELILGAVLSTTHH